MIYAKVGSEAINSFFPYDKKRLWQSNVFGPTYSHAKAPGPQALMVDVAPGEVVSPHFHGTAQFQVFPAGSGVIGRNEKPIQSLMVQFKDHHTAYGPIVAGPCGLAFISMRVFTGASAAVYLHEPDFREKLKPSKRRNWLSPQVELSTVSTLRHREGPSWEPLWDPASIDDQMNAQIVRLGGGQAVMGPDPSLAAGYYVFVVNGSIEYGGKDMGLWSAIVVEPNEKAFEIKAGAQGLEALVLEFPLDYE